MKKTNYFFVLLLFISCNNNTNEFESIEIDFTEIGKGTLSGSGLENISQSNLIIQNQAEWQNLLNRIDSINEITTNFTEIETNFDDFIIIAIFLEVKGSGYEVEINRIIENESAINISIQETEYTTLVMTQPFHIVKIPITDKIIFFE